MIPRRLYHSVHKEMVKEHLVSLTDHDRYLRFGRIVTDENIYKYVEDSWRKPGNIWLGVIEKNHIVAAVHVARDTDTKAELGLSVHPQWRGKKLGQALFERAVIYLRSKQYREVYMHCLAENAVMKHIASKNKMKMFTEYGETEADLILPESTLFDGYTEVLTEQIALYDNGIRHASHAFKTILNTLTEK